MANKVNNRYFGQTGTSTPTLPIRIYNGSAKEGYVVKQVSARRFKCADDTTVNDEDLVVGTQYVIVSVGNTDWASCGATRRQTVGTLFTATAAGSGSGTAYAVLTGKLTNKVTPTGSGEACLVGILASGGTPIPLRSISGRIATDFNSVRYKWSLSDDSTQTLLVLTAI